MDMSSRSCRKAHALPFQGDVGAWKSSLSGTDEVLPDVMVYNYTPIVYISITAGVQTSLLYSIVILLNVCTYHSLMVSIWIGVQSVISV